MKPMDFQHATANRIVEIFSASEQNRVLLADEVGLGKTIVARHVIKTLIDDYNQKSSDDMFRVLYICSNINIAKQNYHKLGIEHEEGLSISESRLSMQHLRLHERQMNGNSKTQLIPMTPATSFSMTGGQGMKKERALIYVFLRQLPDFAYHEKQLSDLLSMQKDIKHWQYEIAEYAKQVHHVDEALNGAYLSTMRYQIQLALSRSLRNEILDICTNEDVLSLPYSRRRNVVNDLRRLFAKISLDMLNPDLVIMDEFQRFRGLIKNEDDESSMLSSRFLKAAETKVLLLSATPYRPYTTFEELAMKTEDHYREFLELMEYLLHSDEKQATFRTVWHDYTNMLAELNSVDFAMLVMKKKQAESAMYNSVCRTERKATAMLDTSKAAEVELLPEDITSYVEMQNLLDKLELGKFPIDYVKSAPYLMSYMQYKIKDKIIGQLEEKGLSKNNAASTTMFLKRRDINNYKKVAPNNARLKRLYGEVFDEYNGTELLLWIPASKPYYQAKSVFEDNQNFSKLLVFSSWEMVPRMISTMTSYEAERRTIGRLKQKHGEEKIQYFPQTAKRRMAYNRLKADSEALLTYPSRFLKNLYNPAMQELMPLSELRKTIKEILSQKINDMVNKLNLEMRPGGAKQFLKTLMMLDGEMPEEPLAFMPIRTVDFLTDMAIGAPAVCALRIHDDKESATHFAKAMISLFNKPEAIGVLDYLYRKGEEHYYEDVIKYCVDGNLQAVLDEYAFVIGLEGSDLLHAMSEAITDTVSVKVETRESFLRGGPETRLRTHFALGYYNTRLSDQSVLRHGRIRGAFNSPFRPFVLATTSIGQEGLDFHAYCRKVMHWNLPANPIDIEQREGRVNRYMCHAIRQNLARSPYAHQPWKEQFWKDTLNQASIAMKGESSDLVPYWSLPDDFNYNVKIERIVPMYPFSQDRYRYERLVDVLSLYRLTLGQPRQEGLLQILKDSDLSLSDLERLYFSLSPIDRMLHHNSEFPQK